MKKFIIVFLFLQLGKAVGQNLQTLEYFLNTDPGFGQGIKVTVSKSADQAVNFVADISSAPAGFNYLVIRGQDSLGRWSPPFSQTIYKETLQNPGKIQLARLEYFFNIDPGPGLGSAVSVTSDTNLAISFIADVKSIPAGFNALIIRGLDANNKWSPLALRVIYKQDIPLTNSPAFKRLEYFINTDPGFGSGKSIPIAGVSDTSVTFIADISSLAPGFNFLCIRGCDVNGKWSLIEHRAIFKENLPLAASPNLSSFEYFFNADPGFGLGKKVPVSAEANQLLTFSADLTGLPVGFNSLVLRGCDANGIWSNMYSRIIYKENITAAVNPKLTAFEYFFNADSGYGKGTPVQVTYSNDQAIQFSADLTNVPSGFNTLCVRGRDENNTWSHVAQRAIYKNKVNPAQAAALARCEYYIDTDPGAGSGTPVIITSGIDQHLLLTMDITKITDGLHQLGIRGMDANGSWSFLATKYFRKITADWVYIINVSDTSGNSRFLSFGQATNATAGIDTALGEQKLTAPGSAFDARFNLPDGKNSGSLTDLRPSSADSLAWTLFFQPQVSNSPITLSWDSLASRLGIMRISTPNNAVTIDMKERSSYVMQSGIDSAYIYFMKQTCTPVTLNRGWNLVSVPALENDMSVAGLFSTADTTAFGFASSYASASTLQAGKGYWVRLPAAVSFVQCGRISELSQITLNTGWNLIGVPDGKLSVTSVSTAPDGLLSSSFFGYSNGGYTKAVQLEGGKGYWIKATQSGTLKFSSSQKKAASSPAVEQSIATDAGTIRFTDARGNTGTLNVSLRNIFTGDYSLPPLPPAGIFDVRFAGDTYAEQLSGTKQIKLTSGIYPITIQVSGISLKLTDGMGGKLVNTVLKSGDSYVLKESGVTSLSVENTIPKEFSLQQNYPNPFNPSTVIKYTLPGLAGPGTYHVSMKLYNILGREVATLVNEEAVPGEYSVTLNAANLASGIYFYVLRAGKFMQTKKMMLLK